MERFKNTQCQRCLNANKTVTAVVGCKDCAQLLCQDCKRVHLSQESTKSHTLAIKTIAKILYCDQCLETGKHLRGIKACSNCIIALCGKCSEKHDQTHTLFEVSGTEERQEITALTCHMCKHNGRSKLATVHCTVCEESLCDGCSNIHKSGKQSKPHKIIKLDSIDYKLCEHCLGKGKTVLVYTDNIRNDNPLCSSCSARIPERANAREQTLVTDSSLARKRLSHDNTQEKEQSQHLVHEQMESRTVVNHPTNAKITKPCDPCREDHREAMAVLHCQQCGENFCEGCSKAHKTQKATTTHQLVDVRTLALASDRSVVNYPVHAKITKPCDPCQEDHREAIAVLHCQQCDENFCDGCSKAHKTQKATKTHQLIDIAIVVQERKVVNHPTNPKITKSCDPCQEDHREAIAVLHYQQCDENFCEGCSKAHKTQKATKTHQLIDIATLALA